MLLHQAFVLTAVAATPATPPALLGTPALLQNTSADPQDFSHQYESGADCLVVVLYNDNAATFSSVTWTATGAGGQSMTQVTDGLAGAAILNTRCAIYFLKSPSVGTNSRTGVISVNLASASALAILPISLSGVGLGTPIGNNQAAVTTNTDPAALAIDPEPNSRIIHAVTLGADTPTITWGGGETELIDTAALSGVLHAGASHKAVTSGDATTVDLLFSASSARYAEVVASFSA